MTTVTRRTLVHGGIAAGAGVVLRRGQPMWAAEATPVTVGAPPLDPVTIPKYVEPLVVPPTMPQVPRERRPADLPGETDYYEIAVRQFQQAILPASLGLQTTVWSYGAIDQPDSFHSPAFSIEATVERPVRVNWVNGLVDADGDFLPHLLPVDPTLHWANPGGGVTARDQRPRVRATPEAYAGPVPIVVHLHGGICRRPATSRPGLPPPERSTTRSRPSSLTRGARPGSREQRSSSMPTTSGRPPSGFTTTPWV